MLRNAALAQLVEHMLGKHEVSGPNPDSSSNIKKHPIGVLFYVGAPILSMRSGRGTRPVRIRRPKIDKLACQAQGARILAQRVSGKNNPSVILLAQNATSLYTREAQKENERRTTDGRPYKVSLSKGRTLCVRFYFSINFA